MSTNFNDFSKDKSRPAASDTSQPGEDVFEKSIRTGERTRFIHKPNPLVDRAYQIFEYNIESGIYEHVGDYALLNKDEPREATERKVMNLMNVMNKKKDFLDLSNLTKTRVLYTLIPEAQAGNQTKVIFKDYDGSGVSKDNAVFTIRKGVFSHGSRKHI